MNEPLHAPHNHDIDHAAIPADQKAICPVTADPVDKREAEKLGHVREHAGKQYYFCCGTCVQLFDAHPEKYATHHKLHATLRLKEKENLIDNIWAFRFEPSEQLTWVPGQFIRVELKHEQPDDEGTKRWFTVSSAPFEGIIQITTRVTDSTFKQALAVLPIGSELRLLQKPDGDFVWRDSDKPLIFVAGGIGVTPFRSILRQRAHDGQPLAVTLIYGNRTDAIVFKDEFDAYAARDSNFAVRYVVGEPLNAAKLAELAPQLNSSLVYLSGPEPMIEALGKELKAAGLPPAQLQEDFFPNYTEANY